MLLHCVFSGARARVDELLAACAAAGIAASVDETAGQPNTRFHALDHPHETDEELAVRMLAALWYTPIPEPAPQAKTDRDGQPVWDDNSGETNIELLCADEPDALGRAAGLDRVTEVCGRYGFRLRMHADSGFTSLRQAEAVDAARRQPPKHPLLLELETDPMLLAQIRTLLEART